MRWKIYAVMLLLIVPLQATLADPIGIHNTRPDLGLIAACLIGLRWGETEGLAMGFLIGSAMDLFSAGAAGANILSKAAAGFLSGLIGRAFLDLKLFPAAGILAVLSFFSGLVIYLSLQVARGDLDFIESVQWIIFPQAVYDGVLGAALLRLTPRTSAVRTD